MLSVELCQLPLFLLASTNSITVLALETIGPVHSGWENPARSEGINVLSLSVPKWACLES